MTATRKIHRIGPKMLQALAVIASNPSCSKHYVSVIVGPHGSNAFGWRIVQRCIAAGLVAAQITGRGYRLTLTEAGQHRLSASR